MHFRLKLNSFCRRKGAFSHGNFHLNVFLCNQLGTAQLLGYWILIIKSNSVCLSTREVVDLSYLLIYSNKCPLCVRISKITNGSEGFTPTKSVVDVLPYYKGGII